MARLLIFLFFLTGSRCVAQNARSNTSIFCNNLHKIIELGTKDNFDSYDGTLVKQSAFLPVPGYAIKLDGFAVNYVDKDNRFVAKTNLNLDSASAVTKIQDLINLIDNCLDSTWGYRYQVDGDDLNTLFFKESLQSIRSSPTLDLSIAVVFASPKIYSVNLYIRRRR